MLYKLCLSNNYLFVCWCFRDQNSEGQESEGRVVPQEVVVPQMMSPQTSLSPGSSPKNVDYDSSYETGSPGSTVVTSPGSPGMPRTSISSESDQVSLIFFFVLYQNPAKSN